MAHFNKNVVRAFIINFDKLTLSYYCYDIHETRTSKIDPIFKGMKLFKGKKITLETTFAKNSMTTKFNESDESKIIQILKYKYFILKSKLEFIDFKSFLIGLTIGLTLLFIL